MYKKSRILLLKQSKGKNLTQLLTLIASKKIDLLFIQIEE